MRISSINKNRLDTQKVPHRAVTSVYTNSEHTIAIKIKYIAMMTLIQSRAAL